MAVQETYSARINDLQLRLTKLRGRYKILEKRRAMEMEGFSRDISALKRHIVKLETLCYGTKLTQQELKSLRIGTYIWKLYVNFIQKYLIKTCRGKLCLEFQ